MQHVSSLEYLLYLAKTVGEFWAAFIPVTGTIAVTSVWATAAAFHKPDIRWPPVLTAWSIPALFPLLVLLVGVAYVDSSALAFVDKAPPRPWVENAPEGQPAFWMLLIGISFLISMALLGWWRRRDWGIVLASGLFWGQLLFFAGVVAQMSYAGLWL